MSLVSCPVKLYPATTKANRITFNTLNRATGHRINIKPHDPETGEELERDKLVKGYEFEKGRYVVIDEEEIDKVRIPSSKTIELEEFVDAAEIDTAYYENPYYLTPDGPVADETYRTIREAIAERGRVGIGRVVLSRRERLVAVQPRGPGLMMTTLRSRDEVRNDEEFFSDIGEGKLDAEMVELAAHIIAKKSGKFEPGDIQDRYQAELLTLMQAKMRGETPRIEAPRGPAKVINLKDALRRRQERQKAWAESELKRTGPESLGSLTMNQTRILVVDDEPDVLDTLKEFLTDRGYAVVTAANSLDAESLIESRSVSLALLDVGVHGLRLAKKALDEGKPFILMSGAPVVIEMGELGGVMRKPFRLAELQRTIERLLDAERARPAPSMQIGQTA